MDSKPMTVMINLEQLAWTEALWVTGGGGFGSSDPPTILPFVWVVFFKIDGSSVTVKLGMNANGDLTYLQGSPTVVDTPGNHGDLGWGEWSFPEARQIDAANGSWIDSIIPIPVDPALQPLLMGASVKPAVFGAVVVLMADGGHIPRHAIAAGHQMLVQQIGVSLQALMDGITPAHQDITDEDIATAVKGVPDAVTNAIKNSMSWWEKLWAVTGEDQQICQFVLHWTQDMFGDNGSTLPVDASATSGWGTFKLNGSVTLSLPCPAEAWQAVLDAFLGLDSTADSSTRARWSVTMDTMRAFRDAGGLRDYPGIARWWKVAMYHTPAVARILSEEPSARKAFTVLLDHGAMALGNPKKPLPNVLRKGAEVLCSALMESSSGLLQYDAHRAKAVLASLENVSTRDALRRFSDVALATPPKTNRHGRRASKTKK